MRINKAIVANLREKFPVGCRVELIRMDDVYSWPNPGLRGTVACVDDIGTIHVNWDNGCTLGVLYGVDTCKRIY